MGVSAILNLLLIIGSVHGFIFNVGTFLARKRIEKPIVFLNLLVFFLSLNNLQSWLISKGLVFDVLFFKHLVVPWYVLILPMFYAFLIFYLGIEKKKVPYLKLTLVIFVLELLVRSAVLTLVAEGVLKESMIPMYNAIEDAVTLLYSLFIFKKAIQLIFRSPELYPAILTFDDLQWVKRFMKWGALIFLLWSIAVLLNIFSDTIKAPYSYYPLRIASSVLIYWIGYQAFFRYVVLKDRIVLRKEIRDIEKEERTATKEPLTAQKGNRQAAEYEKIHSYVVNRQRYFDPGLSLDKLSDELAISTSKLSALINQFSACNFSDYVNGLRVQDAKKLLENPDFEKYTMVSIGLECGFNSKSTFYAAFKKFTGKTPTEYQKEYAQHP